MVLKAQLTIQNIQITLIKGEHGKGEVGKMMGNSYGFMLKNNVHETIYITGDTVYCDTLEVALKTYMPTYVIAFAGSAMINHEHITLNADEIKEIMNVSKNSKVIAIHMGVWNHCQLTRTKLKEIILNKDLYTPEDGEIIHINHKPHIFGCVFLMLKKATFKWLSVFLLILLGLILLPSMKELNQK